MPCCMSGPTSTASSAVSFYQFWIIGQKKRKSCYFRLISSSFYSQGTLPICSSCKHRGQVSFYISWWSAPLFAGLSHTRACAQRKRAGQRERTKLLPLSLEQIVNSIYVKKRTPIHMFHFHAFIFHSCKYCMSLHIHTKACTPPHPPAVIEKRLLDCGDWSEKCHSGCVTAINSFIHPFVPQWVSDHWGVGAYSVLHQARGRNIPWSQKLCPKLPEVSRAVGLSNII